MPFTIGIYAGHHKRNNPVTYLKPYIEDLKKLQTTGMVYHSKNYLVNLTCVVCDAQARVFIKQVKSSAGYLGCDKCIQSEVHDGKKMTFLETNATLRTDGAFKAMSDEDYHRGPNPFCKLPIGMVSQFPIDYMHLVCLGVIKRFILLCISGPLKVRIGGKVQQNITDFLLILRKSIPMEFARKPKTIADVS